ncbi:MAG TPA: cell division protein FtsL [Acidobacteriaceae bacterium]|jgi:cell division protein FtsL|nr:cell division protein FtsL [Acidobacteriaceae bacterium]
MATASIAMETFRQRNQWSAEAAMEHNRLQFAAELRARRGPTPEAFFDKRLDNSRLVKADDPQRKRDMRNFAIAATVFFALLMTYALQHFRSVEFGYQVEAQKQQLEHLHEQNRQLNLTEARLSQPERMDKLARQMGLATPQPGQFVTPSMTDETSNGPLLAQVAEPAPVATMQ